MSTNGNKRLEEIIEAAFDVDDADKVSPKDLEKFKQFQKIAAHLRSGFYSAPDALVEAAKALMPAPMRRKLSIRILGTSFGLAGARLDSGDEAQVVVEAEGVEVRLMYGRTALGWQLLGAVDRDGWTATCTGNTVECGPDGRFSFSVADVEHTEVSMSSNEAEFVIPPFEDLLKGDRELDRPR